MERSENKYRLKEEFYRGEIGALQGQLREGREAEILTPGVETDIHEQLEINFVRMRYSDIRARRLEREGT